MGGEREIAAKGEFARTDGKLDRPSDRIFDALADPTRRAIFERLSALGELKVRSLTKHFGITQQAVARHLSVLHNAGLVTCRHDGGRANHYSARPPGAAPLLRWLAHQGIVPRDQKTSLARGTVGQRLGTKTAFDAIVELKDAYAKAETQYMAAARKAITARKHAFDKADSELLATAERAIQTAVQRLASSIEAVQQGDPSILETDRTHPIPEPTPSHH
jgi:DNA-binding transcriptional ArsR family regulator